MEYKDNNPKLLFTGIASAVAASLCCIAPVLAVVAGFSGLASMFSWLDVFRSYFIVVSVLVLALAWYLKLKPAKKQADCACDEARKEPFIQSKRFLAVVSILAMVLLAFPFYSHLFMPAPAKSNAAVVFPTMQQARLSIKGMTCKGCENTVNHALSTRQGVIKTSTSYDKGLTEVSFDPATITPETLKDVIESETGYQVTGMEVDTQQQTVPTEESI